MPRTKATNKKAVTKWDQEGIDRLFLLEHLRTVVQGLRGQVKKKIFDIIDDDQFKLFEQFSTVLNTKLGDLKDNNSFSKSATSVNVTYKQDLLNSTKSLRSGRKRLTRSSSATDEGYLTTESSNSVDRISKHEPRSKSKKIKEKVTSTRTTRSLSRSHTDSSNTGFVTPLNKKPSPNTYGIVTPKCKPNTPHVLLRRPKYNEVALSFQGSPLLTAPVASDEFANINIPLNDGSLLSLRPQKGLRLSQIPQFDHDTLKQLQTLNEHISMVLGAAQLDSF